MRSPLDEPLAFTADEVERSLCERFAKVASVCPSAAAIAAGTRRLSYAQLDRSSDAVAGAILLKSQAPEAPIALLLADPLSTTIAMLAAWKAGRLCVPLDASVPPRRIEAMLRDSDAALVVTDLETSAVLSSLPEVKTRGLRWDEVDLAAPSDLPRATATAETLAALFYTSGSTGRPKAVIHSHGSLLNCARAFIQMLGVQPADRFGTLSSSSFMIGLRDMLAALLSGAALLPFDPRSRGSRALAEWIDREEISVLSAVTSTLRHLVTAMPPGKRLPSVRCVRTGSEQVFHQDVEQFRERFRPDCLLVATYGASEASGITAYRVTPGASLPAGRVPAGHPFEGVELLVLDDDWRAVECGRQGEVAVRSRYLASGYWRRPDLTRAVFLDDPTEPRSRIYLTGDIGRLRPDGCLEVFGRKDDEVKVRGYRVHPGEIELALTEHPAIREAAVITRTEQTETQLVAYVVPDASAPTPAELRRFLAPRIPGYMMPSAIVNLEAFPLTPTGKVDRGALPAPPPPALRRMVNWVQPRSPLEHQIAAIWEGLFAMAPVGAHDDFFDLGGDSLLAAGLMAAIEEACGRVLSPAVLLEAPTVASLAARILQEDGGVTEPITALRASGHLTSLFFVHNDAGRGLYTHALARLLHPDRPVYAVHLHGFSDGRVPPTVEAIAAERVLALRAVRPEGPYVLGGHCHGGFVALEMARRLRAEGESVEAVVMVDTMAPSGRVRMLHHASEILGRLRGLSEAERHELFKRLDQRMEKLTLWASYYRGRLRIARGLTGRARLVLVARKVLATSRAVVRALAGRRLGPAAATSEKPTGPAEQAEDSRRVLRCYMPRPYGGRVFLLRAEELRAARPDLGWSGLLSRPTVTVIPGDHHTCITRHVAVFAEQLEAMLGLGLDPQHSMPTLDPRGSRMP